MTGRPTRSDRGGRAYLDLQRQARRTGRNTQELLVRYVLERFLYRLGRTPWRDKLVLKGGMLLVVFDVRRPTQDLDMAARALRNSPGDAIAWARDVFAVDVDDGVVFDPGSVRAAPIREADVYPGVRVHAKARLATAEVALKVDVNFGDPVVPAPRRLLYPSLLGEPFEVLAYPMAAVLGEKVETMVRRGNASTRERDFADVWLITRAHEVDASELRSALLATASARGTELVPLAKALGSYAALRQRAWADFVARAGLAGAVPERLEETVRDVGQFVDPVLSGEVTEGTWGPAAGSWTT